MNKKTTQKYISYRQIASDVEKQILELNEKCNIFKTNSIIYSSFTLKISLLYTYYCYLDKSLEPYLSQIDQIEDSVSKLEQAAFKLDAYAKRLEGKYKSLEKRQ